MIKTSQKATTTPSRTTSSRLRIAKADVLRVMSAYPRVYFACHTRHVRDPKTDEEISRHQASILDHLDGVEGTSLLELADHMGVTPSTMSLNIDRLERRGYVTRERDTADRRRVLLKRTAAGTRVSEAQSVLDPQLVRSLLAELPAAERQQAIAGLELLAKAGNAAMRKQARKRGRGARKQSD